MEPQRKVIEHKKKSAFGRFLRILGPGLITGSTVGGIVPSLWGVGMFSMSGVFLTAVGGIVGIWAGWKVAGY